MSNAPALQIRSPKKRKRTREHIEDTMDENYSSVGKETVKQV